MKSLLLVLFLGTISHVSFAHEGHNTTPGSKVAAPHGGKIEGTADFYLELVGGKDGFKVYPLEHELVPIPLDNFTLEPEAKVTFPRKQKAQTVKLTPENGEYFAAKLDAKGTNRYIVEVRGARKGKKQEKLKFNVELK